MRKGTPNYQEIALDIKYDGQRLARLADKYLQRCRSKLQAYIVYTDLYQSDNSNWQAFDYKYVLKFPPDWQPVMLQQLADELHSYTVNSVLADFYKVSLPHDSSLYAMEADDCGLEIKHIITSRIHSPLHKRHGLPWFIWKEIPKVEPIPNEDIYRLSDH